MSLVQSTGHKADCIRQLQRNQTVVSVLVISGPTAEKPHVDLNAIQYGYLEACECASMAPAKLII